MLFVLPFVFYISAADRPDDEAVYSRTYEFAALSVEVDDYGRVFFPEAGGDGTQQMMTLDLNEPAESMAALWKLLIEHGAGRRVSCHTLTRIYSDVLLFTSKAERSLLRHFGIQEISDLTTDGERFVGFNVVYGEGHHVYTELRVDAVMFDIETSEVFISQSSLPVVITKEPGGDLKGEVVAVDSEEFKELQEKGWALSRIYGDQVDGEW